MVKNDIEVAGQAKVLESVVQNAEVETKSLRLAAGKAPVPADKNARCRVAAGDQDRLVARFPDTAEDALAVRKNTSAFFPGAPVSAGDEGRPMPLAEKAVDQLANDRGFSGAAQRQISHRNDRERNPKGGSPPFPVSGGLPGANRPGYQGIGLQQGAHFIRNIS